VSVIKDSKGGLQAYTDLTISRARGEQVFCDGVEIETANRSIMAFFLHNKCV